MISPIKQYLRKELDIDVYDYIFNYVLASKNTKEINKVFTYILSRVPEKEHLNANEKMFKTLLMRENPQAYLLVKNSIVSLWKRLKSMTKQDIQKYYEYCQACDMLKNNLE